MLLLASLAKPPFLHPSVEEENPWMKCSTEEGDMDNEFNPDEMGKNCLVQNYFLLLNQQFYTTTKNFIPFF